MKELYITTTLPYVNADPHIGFALEIVQADILARYHTVIGDQVFFNTGTDEHGLKIYRNAQEAGKDTQSYVDEYAAKFHALKDKLHLTKDVHFIRTTDAHHKSAAQEFWRRCQASGDIYKKNYEVKYCVGCELEKTDSELVDGRCPLHPNLEIEIINEENYFFRWSKYREKLIEMYERRPDFVVPEYRFNEIKKFVEKGLEDFSISRLASKMPWGVPVPDDPTHVMYVWFDALINYISTLGWPEDLDTFEKFWGTHKEQSAIQLAGKDQIRQQSAMWQAMLMSAGLPQTRQIVIHGFITVGGQKMSKSLGNVIDPMAIVDEYGADALRLFLARHIHPFEDSDFSTERFKECYNADLANGLGNLVARITALAEAYLKTPIVRPQPAGFHNAYTVALDAYDFNAAADFIWEHIQKLDRKITETEPFKVIKTDPERGRILIEELCEALYFIARLLSPIMPATAKEIKNSILSNRKPLNLFPRKE